MNCLNCRQNVIEIKIMLLEKQKESTEEISNEINEPDIKM